MRLSLIPAGLLPLLFAGCLHVKVEPIKVHAVVDINVKVDRALDDFFGELDEMSTTLATDTTASS